MAEEVSDLDMQALMEMLGEEMPEEGGGVGLGLLGGLAGAGAAGAYVGSDPYRRELVKLLMSPEADVGRKELFGQIWEGAKFRWDDSTKGMDRMSRINAARAQMMAGLPQPKPVGFGTVAAGREIVPYGAKAAAPGVAARAPTLHRLLGAAGRSGTGLLSKLPWLKWALFPGLGWLSAGLLAGDAARLGWNQFVTKPRERKEQNINAAYGLGGAFDRAKAEIEEQALADQLELLAEGSDLPRTPGAELSQILATHDLSKLFEQRAPMPKPTFQQALEMVGGV